MGVLNITEQSDVIAYVRDIYKVGAMVNHEELHKPSCGIHPEDTIVEFMERQPLAGPEREVIDKALLTATAEMFKRKFNNGLYKSFIIQWQEIQNGWFVVVMDSNRSYHIRLILSHKSKYGFLQKAKNLVTGIFNPARK